LISRAPECFYIQMICGRITPEELKERLAPGGPWVECVCLGETDSTNSRAMEMASAGAPHGTVVVADAQSGGRGRFGRQWISPPGKNIYASLLLRPEIPNAKAAGLSLAAGVALADAAAGAGVPALLKWPNDLYLGERKAAGVLVETASEGDVLRHVVVGVGINVNLSEGELPEGLRGKATSLRIHAGRTFPRAEILARFLDAFAARYAEYVAGGFPAIRPAWERSDMLRGRRALLRRSGEEAWGVALGVDADGALLFRPDGTAADETVHSAEILEFEARR
jgi:BirA family biotin operon repressor/biotin-[acetyl-CoA-carboxylase] ligase